MSTMTRLTAPEEIEYPEDDGKPMAENTEQYNWITKIKWNLERVFRDDPNVFVAGDLLWYPVERDNKTSRAPDVLVALGRPKGRRSSYLQWLEGGIAPQVVFEILSPSNRGPELALKFAASHFAQIRRHHKSIAPERDADTPWQLDPFGKHSPF